MSGPALHGWIILDKPVGIGSTSCVGAVKRALRESGCAKVKVGHGGTLDPLASGVLPIALGEATKLCGRMLDASKANVPARVYQRLVDVLEELRDDDFSSIELDVLMKEIISEYSED